jgi:hypothetical protein
MAVPLVLGDELELPIKGDSRYQPLKRNQRCDLSDIE